MTNLVANAGWDNVPQLEKVDLALGGPNGPMNWQAQTLLNRTEWLKDGLSLDLASFGVVGDGVTDDTAALQAALDSSSVELDGRNKTYAISAGLVSTVAHRLRNFKLKTSLPASTTALKFTGTQGADVLTTADSAKGTFSITVADASTFTVYGWLFIHSTDDFSPAVTMKNGELCRIKAISGNVITVYAPLMVAYPVASSTKVAPVSMPDVELHNVEIIGSTSSAQETGIEIIMCDNVVISNVKTADCQYAHILLTRVGKALVWGGYSKRTGAANGLNYGIVVARGSSDVVIIGYTCEDMRHAVTIGGSEGIARSVRAYECTANGALDAGFDAHPGVMFVDYSHNIVNTSVDASASGDGIICQGANFIAIGNRINGAKRHGIMYQPLLSAGIVCSAKIADNSGRTAQALTGAYFVNVNADSTTLADIVGATVRDNDCTGWPNVVQIYAKARNIKNYSVKGNYATDTVSGRLIYVRADDTFSVSNGVIDGNYGDISGTESIYLQGITTGRIKNTSIGRNVTTGTGSGLRLLGTDTISTDGTNRFLNATAVTMDTASVSVVLAERAVPVTTTNAAYTVLPTVGTLTVNRAATVTVTLPGAAIYPGRRITIKTLQAQTVISAASDVVPITGGAGATAILPATAGAWAVLESDGAAWVVISRGT